MLRDTIAAMRGKSAADGPLAEFATGRLPGILTAPSGADVLSAVELADEYGLKLGVDPHS